MSEFLTVRLSSQKDTPIPWLVWSTNQNEVIASGELADWTQLSDLTGYAAQRTVIVLVSARDVVLTDVEIPAGASRQLDTMLPYLLEDDLAQDADELHFTQLARQGSHAYVCGLDRNWLRTLLDELREHQIDVKKVLPDVLALPEYPEGISAAQLGELWLLRKGPYRALSIESEWLPILAASEWVSDDDGEAPLALRSYSALPELNLSEGADWRCDQPALIMQLLTEHAISSKVNLLSGEFKPKSSLLKHWRLWRPAAVAAGLLLVTSSVYAVLQIQQYEAQAQQYRAESERIFRAALPGRSKIPTVGYLKRLMEQEANRLSGGNAEDSILVVMTKMTDTFRNSSDMQLQSIRYDGNRGEVRLQAQSKDFQSFEKARVELAKHFSVEQGQLTRSGEVVNGSFVLKRK